MINTDEGSLGQKLANEQIAQVLQINSKTVERVKQRFVEEGFDACMDRRPYPKKGPIKTDGDFVAHMESVLDVYKPPYNKRYPVVCMDESPKQLIKQTRIPIARKPGQDEKQDYEYSRQGVANIFMANEPLKGKRYIRIKKQGRRKIGHILSDT